jgi:hypothetical protein
VLTCPCPSTNTYSLSANLTLICARPKPYAEGGRGAITNAPGSHSLAIWYTAARWLPISRARGRQDTGTTSVGHACCPILGGDLTDNFVHR